jgi:cysteine synthase
MAVRCTGFRFSISTPIPLRRRRCSPIFSPHRWSATADAPWRRWPGTVDYLIGGLGTTGSTRGTASYLRKHNPELRTIAVVSDRTDFIPGIRSESEMWDVGLFQPDFYDRIVTIDSARAVDATLRLATGYGVLAGPTSGASYAAALEILRAPELSTKTSLVAVFIVFDPLGAVPVLHQEAQA